MSTNETQTQAGVSGNIAGGAASNVPGETGSNVPAAVSDSVIGEPPSDTSLPITVKENLLMASYIKNLKVAASEINETADFERIASECGYIDEHSAQIMFSRLKKKMDAAVLTTNLDVTVKRRAKRKAKDEAGPAPKRGRTAKSDKVVDPADDEDPPETKVAKAFGIDASNWMNTVGIEGGDVHGGQLVKKEEP